MKNDLVKALNFLEEINPQSTNECTAEFKKSEKRTFEGILGMGKSAHIYKTQFCNTREEFICWCEKELSYKENTVNRFIKYYEIFSANIIDYNNTLKFFGTNKLDAITSLCEYELKYYEDDKKLSTPKIDRYEDERRKFNTYHMDNFIEQNKDNLEDITLQELKKLVKDYKITNDLIKEKKQELKESEQKLAETYEELATVTAETDKIKYVQTTIGNIVTKLNVLFEDDDYKTLIKDEDIKKELEINLVSARNKINDLLNEISLEKYNYKNIIEVEVI